MARSTTTLLHATRAKSNPAIATQFCGKSPTPITAEPSAQPRTNSNSACEPGSLPLRKGQTPRPSRQANQDGIKTDHDPLTTDHCLSAFPVHPLWTIHQRDSAESSCGGS